MVELFGPAVREDANRGVLAVPGCGDHDDVVVVPTDSDVPVLAHVGSDRVVADDFWGRHGMLGVRGLPIEVTAFPVWRQLGPEAGQPPQPERTAGGRLHS